MIFSNILDTVGRMLIGLRFSTQEVSPFLKTGVIEAPLRCLGKFPEFNAALKQFLIGKLQMLAYF